MQKYNKKRVILVLKGVVPVPLNFHFYVIPHLASPIHLLHPFPRRPISQNTEPDTVSVLSSGNESAFVVLSWTLWVWTGVVESALVVFSLLRGGPSDGWHFLIFLFFSCNTYHQSRDFFPSWASGLTRPLFCPAVVQLRVSGRVLHVLSSGTSMQTLCCRVRRSVLKKRPHSVKP